MWADQRWSIPANAQSRPSGSKPTDVAVFEFRAFRRKRVLQPVSLILSKVGNPMSVDVCSTAVLHLNGNRAF